MTRSTMCVASTGIIIILASFLTATCALAETALRDTIGCHTETDTKNLIVALDRKDQRFISSTISRDECAFIYEGNEYTVLQIGGYLYSDLVKVRAYTGWGSEDLWVWKPFLTGE